MLSLIVAIVASVTLSLAITDTGTDKAIKEGE